MNILFFVAWWFTRGWNRGRTVITVSIWGENSILKKDINGPIWNKIPKHLNADTILICPPQQLQQSNFSLVLIMVRQQRIEGSVNIQTPTFVIIGWETGTKYILPEMLLITICFLSRHSFLCSSDLSLHSVCLSSSPSYVFTTSTLPSKTLRWI